LPARSRPEWAGSPTEAVAPGFAAEIISGEIRVFLPTASAKLAAVFSKAFAPGRPVEFPRRTIRVVRASAILIGLARPSGALAAFSGTSAASRTSFARGASSPTPALMEASLKFLKLPLPPLSLLIGQGRGYVVVHLFDYRIHLGLGLLLDLAECFESRLADQSNLFLLFRGKIQDVFEASGHH
jgi:hypothetical protein